MRDKSDWSEMVRGLLVGLALTVPLGIILGFVALKGAPELRHMSILEPMAEPEPARRIEVFMGAGRRRSWSAA